MKKTLKQLALFLLVGSFTASLTSCGSDDPDPINAPTVSIAADKTTAAPGESVRLTIVAAAEEQLKNLRVTMSASGASATTILDTTFASGRNTATINYDFLVGGLTGANYVFTATVTDRKDVTATSSRTVNVSGTGSSDLQICSNVTLGSYSNSQFGSSFATSSCTVYKVADARSNSTNVDFIYFYGSTNNATLSAPNDDAAGSISTFDLANWNTRNATKLKKLSNFDFGMATKASIEAAVGTSGDTKVNNLAVGDVVGFATAAGKHGVARVKDINGGQSGTIVLDVKTTK